MTPDQIEGMIKYAIGVLGSIAGATVAVCTWLKTRDSTIKAKYAADVAIAKENSAGAQAIVNLLDADRKMREDIEDLKKNDHIREEDIHDLAQDQKKLTDRIFDFFKLKQ